MGPEGNSCWKGPQDASTPTSCSKQGHPRGHTSLLWAVFSLLLKPSQDGDTETSLGPSLVPQTSKISLGFAPFPLFAHSLHLATLSIPGVWPPPPGASQPYTLFFFPVFEPQMSRGSQAPEHLLCGLLCISLSPGTTSHLSHPASSGAQIPPFVVLPFQEPPLNTA